ncbi:mitochondrial ubiquitin ligase activator of nfkb 1-A [Hoplias malabaricus]|uniref:mitochondrial ubiquitin ligase activator of nfkb 1-A n=1 Tax=Hoplias malabaricus TaxID=27720 RepID=UPI003462E1D5
MSDSFLSPWTLVGVGASFAFSSVFFNHYQQKKVDIQKLKEIPSFQADEHLLKILKASPDRRLHYVAVEGVVQPVGEPLASQFVPQCFGVVQKITAKEHWKFRNSSGVWVSKSLNAKETKNSTPFWLVPRGSYLSEVRVRVESPLKAEGDYLEQVHSGIRQVDSGLLDGVLQDVMGEKLTAHEEREELLRVGTVLTGFGELVLDNGAVMRLQPPRDGRTFVLLPGDHRSFLQRHENTASMWKAFSAVSGLTGATLLAAFLYSAVNKDQRRR